MNRFEQLDLDQFRDEVADRFTDMTDLLVKKRASYGPSNLVRFGPMGIVIRASDKIDRLATMCRDGTAHNPDGDSMDDAFKDLIGYGVLGLMLTQMEGEKEGDG